MTNPYNAPPQAPAKKKRKWPWVTAAIVVLIIIIAVVSSGGGSKGSSVPAAADNAALSTTSAAPVTAAPKSAPVTAAPKSAPVTAAPKSAAPAAPQTLLNVSGNGIKQTQTFTAAGAWDLSYTYDCSAYGGTGNFAVSVYGSDGSPSFANSGVNELGAGGTDVTHEHHGGTYYLSILSECKWTVKVTG